VKLLKRNLLLALVAVLLLSAIAGALLTRNASVTTVDARQPARSPINDRLLATARRAAATADTADQQALAQEALRLADNEYDVAFAAALREAAAAPPPTSGPLKKLVDRIAAARARIAAGQESLAAMEKKPGTDESRLELAKAQLALDQDELAAAQEDLARQGGDRHATLERMRQEHEAGGHGAQAPKPSGLRPTGTLSEQLREWLLLRDRDRMLDAARQEASDRATRLGRGHDALDAFIHNQPPPPGLAPAMLDRFRRMSDHSKALVELDKRIQDAQQLADVYQRWDLLVEARRDAVLHLLLISCTYVLAVLFAVVAIGRGIRYAFVRKEQDRRRMHQMQFIATTAVEVVGVLVILFIVFGLPNQTSTMIGLTTAGLTVVLKDFIVAFFGWFVLLGKNGIRIGDWVEIEGVGGEVVEIGLLKTVVLEMGDWTKTGHPTGRRVSFNNKFAIENHYFNFSTAGQWLWDELKVTLPDISDAYQMALQIREAVEKETSADAALAEQEWQRATHRYSALSISSRPTVDLQPSANGLQVVVRYITRAPQRYEVKSKLLEAVVDLVHKRSVEAGL
jgi:small-conductance mechanosensitive channel